MAAVGDFGEAARWPRRLRSGPTPDPDGSVQTAMRLPTAPVAGVPPIGPSADHPETGRLSRSAEAGSDAIGRLKAGCRQGGPDTMARLPYADPEEMPDGYEELLVSSLQGRPINAYRVLGTNPEILRGERAFAATLWNDTGLDPRRRELVILAVAREMDSPYEWHQHVRIAPNEGVTRDEIEAIAAGRTDRFDPDERVLMEYAVAVIRGRVDDALHEEIAARYAESTVVGIALLAAGYQLVARFLDAFDVDLEESFVGWDLTNYEQVVHGG